MLVPIRCFTCGNLIADKYSEYQEKVRNGGEPKEMLDQMDIKRYCCRRMMLTTVETIHQIIPFYEAMYRQNEKFRSDIN